MLAEEVNTKELEVLKLLWEIEKGLKDYTERGYNSESKYFKKTEQKDLNERRKNV